MKKLLQGFLRLFDREAPKETPQTTTASIQEATSSDIASKITQNVLPQGIRRRQEKIYLQVGVDFGTSSTKVAYRQLGGRVELVRPILFQHNLPNYPRYCLPSLGAFDVSGRLLFGDEAAQFLLDKDLNNGVKLLKMVLAGRHDPSFYDAAADELFHENLKRDFGGNYQPSVEQFVTAFIAFVLRRIRVRLKEHYPNNDLDVAYNVCIPIDYEQNNPVKLIFSRVLRAAELLESRLDESWSSNILLERAADTYDSTGIGTETIDQRVFLIPESVGAIASYLTSLRKKSGIHAAYDFGAGTTDISIFNVFQNAKGGPVAYWYAARNLPQGSESLERRLCNFVRAQNPPVQLSALELSNLVGSLSNQTKNIREEIHGELTGLWEKSHDTWRAAYGRLRKQGEWEKEKVQVFVCGGASKLPFIKEIFSQSWMPKWGPYKIADLPGPDIYDNKEGEAPFERLCVAYGLTTPGPELGEYRLPRDCPDHTPEKKIRPPVVVYGTTDPDA